MFTREYPAALKEAGIGGTARVDVLVDVDGVVQDVRISDGTGYQDPDDAALSVVRVFRFSPALNEGENVAVWIEIPLMFTVGLERQRMGD